MEVETEEIYTHSHEKNKEKEAIMETKIRQVWQAEKYHENSGVQKEAAMHLLKLLRLSGKESILDVGCGDGKITAAIADSLTEGSICGTDISAEMIKFASTKYPSSRKLKFLLQDAQEVNHSNQFDIIFSSFVLQWVLNIESFFRTAHQSLKQTGRLACTIPLGISDALESALAFLINQSQWGDYFKDFELNYYLRDENIYSRLLSDNSFVTIYFRVVEQEWIFPSRKCFELYTLMWLPHLNALPEHLQDTFFNQLVDTYVEINPTFKNGMLSFRFPRLDFIAIKK